MLHLLHDRQARELRKCESDNKNDYFYEKYGHKVFSFHTYLLLTVSTETVNDTECFRNSYSRKYS